MPTRKAIHKWTTSDRELLCLLKTQHSRKLITPTFNYLLATQLANEGFQNGVSAPSLDAQYGEMKAGGNGYNIYVRINNLSEDDIKTKYGGRLNQINLAIRTLGLKVQSISRISKAKAKAKQKTSPKIRKRRTNRAQDVETVSTSPEPEDQSNLVRPQLQQFVHHHSPYFQHGGSRNNNTQNSGGGLTINDAVAISPTLRIHTNSNGLPAAVRPLLLFRCASNIKFESRKYAKGKKCLPALPAFNTKEYREWAMNHLRRHQDYPSPFISFAQSAKDALGRLEIAVSEVVETKKFLAIFAFNDLEADAARNFGAGAGPHLVRALFGKSEISDLPKGYTGGGEVSMVHVDISLRGLTPTVVSLGLHQVSTDSRARCCTSRRSSKSSAKVSNWRHYRVARCQQGEHTSC